MGLRALATEGDLAEQQIDLGDDEPSVTINISPKFPKSAIYKPFTKNFSKCAPKCTPDALLIYPGWPHSNCLDQGRALNLFSIKCNNKRYESTSPKFKQMASCMKEKMSGKGPNEGKYKDFLMLTLGCQWHKSDAPAEET